MNKDPERVSIDAEATDYQIESGELKFGGTPQPEDAQAVKRLFAAAQRGSAQSGSIARFLLALYEGKRFPFDLTELRSVHHELFSDCLTVLRMDVNTRQEIHSMVDGGGKAFEQLAEKWAVLDVTALRDAARLTGLGMRGL